MMAELTNLESKLGEVTGLAMAAQVATATVIKLATSEAESLVPALERMRSEAQETERRCTELAATFDGKKTAILEEARATKSKGAEMLKVYLDGDSDALDGLKFLTICEAGEVGHWSVLERMGERAGNTQVRELVAWALPIQQAHFEGVLAGSNQLAADEDPNESA
jgi:hypothetical protein